MPLDEDRPDIPGEQARWARGEEDPLRVVTGDADFGHPLQYAVTGHPHGVTVVGTGNATDETLRNLAKAAGHTGAIERFNRCPTCEQWSPCSVRKAWREKLPGAFNPEACAHGYTYGQYCDAYGEFGGAVDAAHIAEPDGPPPTDLLATARNAVDELAIRMERDNLSIPLPGLAHAAAVTAIAESLAAVGAAVQAAMPGVLRTLAEVGKAASDAYSGQTVALQRIAAVLESHRQVVGTPIPLGDVETADLEEFAQRWRDDVGPVAPIEVNTLHAAERLRAKLDRVRELADERQGGGNAVEPSEILAVLDDQPGAPDA